ncbi:MAG: hypothetical protein B5M55_01245 [Desulfococcus sp. 4484_242]|nr:MAG: hypothetical protein B5M55_01245 [Desulfococcus sp. 4484_242]
MHCTRIRQGSASSPLVIFPEDILSHKFRKTCFRLYGEEDEAAPAILRLVKSFAFEYHNDGYDTEKVFNVK